MNKHEEQARMLHKQGNNCSTSLHKVFADEFELSNDIPAPRSIEGKCGAAIVAEKILKEIGKEDKIEEFEKEFISRFGNIKCMELIKKGRRCNDYIGETADIIDNILRK